MKQFALITLAAVLLVSGCSSSGPKTKSQQYAALSTTKEFEEEYAIVWKAVLKALEGMKIEEKDEADGVVETDWVVTTSTEKYFEYTVNGFPRKKFVQARYRYKVFVTKQLGSVKVSVDLNEEVENVKKDGSFDSWSEPEKKDTSRANEMIGKIENAIHSRMP